MNFAPSANEAVVSLIELILSDARAVPLPPEEPLVKNSKVLADAFPTSQVIVILVQVVLLIADS